MKNKIIRLAGRSYVISCFTPSTTKRVITTLRGLNVQELKDIPDAVPIMVNAILSRFKAIFICKRLTSHAKIEDLIEAIGSIIEMIPTNEYYALSTLINNFQKVITK